MERNGEAWVAIAKGSVAWLGLCVGHAISNITLSGVALVITAAYGASQLYWGWRRYFREGRLDEKA
jgi:hypothetical protein